MDVEFLSRLQFAFTITFHYIFPPLSIGISLALIFMEGMYLKTKDKLWETLTKFWVKIFSMTFALGVATGIPLPFSLGTNWARYSRYVGDVFGSLLGAEGFFAFLIEAGFLGILLFGWNRVSSRMHFIATAGVSFGAHFSAIWIVSANSWMHTPAGYRLHTDTDGFQVAQVADWWQMFLNPSNMSHIVHVLLSAWMSGSFMIMSVAAYYLLKKKHLTFAKRTMKVGVVISFACCLLQLVSADDLARKIAIHNPEKFASLEGVYKTAPSTPAYVFGWVDAEQQEVHGLKIPGLLSFMTHRDFTTPVRGLDQFPKDEWPWVPAVFQLYHVMIAMWGLMLIASCIALYYWWKNRWTTGNKWGLRFIVASVVFPQIANIGGWYTSCMGRQPWTVYKLLKTKDAFSPALGGGEIVGSLIMFALLYAILFALFCYLVYQKIEHGPKQDDELVPYRDLFKDDK